MLGDGLLQPLCNMIVVVLIVLMTDYSVVSLRLFSNTVVVRHIGFSDSYVVHSAIEIAFPSVSVRLSVTRVSCE